MKPKPFASLNHFTLPVAMTETFLQGTAPCSARRDGGVIRRHWRTKERRADKMKTPRELVLARRVSRISKHPTEHAQHWQEHDTPRACRQPDPAELLTSAASAADAPCSASGGPPWPGPRRSRGGRGGHPASTPPR